MASTDPTERDLLVALLDGMMAMSRRLWPDEIMQIMVPSPAGKQPFMGSTLTRWTPLADVLAPLSERA